MKHPHREFELLVFLAKNPNIVFSKEALFEKIWGFDYVSDAATVSYRQYAEKAGDKACYKEKRIVKCYEMRKARSGILRAF